MSQALDNVSDGQSTELTRLRITHNLWTKYAPEWSLYLGAYEGGPEFANGRNVFKHFRETPADFSDRTQRLHYINYCEQLVDFYTNFIFSETIDRDGGDEAAFYDDFIKDVDRCGTSINDYMRQISDETQIFGMCYTLVDTPPAPNPDGMPVTKQDDKDKKLRPYWVMLRPDEIVDWVVDDFEKFEYVKRKQITSRVASDGIRIIERYTEFYLDKTVITDVDITDSAKPELFPATTLANTTGAIDIYVHRHKRSKRYSHMGNSFLRDFSYNNREIMNLTSLLQEFLYRQCFNILAKETEGGIPLNTQDSGIIGTNNVIEYPKGGNAPGYISPPADPAKFIQEERERIKQEMFNRASQDSMKELFNGGGASGFSQSQSFSKTVPFIASRADNLEVAENALMTLTMQRVSKTWNGRVKYKDRYEITNIADAMTQFTMLTRDLFLPSEDFDKAELKRLVKEFDGKLSPDTIAKVMQQIDTMDYETWKGVQKDALLGLPKPLPGASGGTSPAAQSKPKPPRTASGSAKEARVPNTGAAVKKR